MSKWTGIAHGVHGLAARLHVSLPGLKREVAQTEKAPRALQQNKLDDAQQYLVPVLTIDPSFADGDLGLLLLRRKDSGSAVAHHRRGLVDRLP
jgi:hypothetical protein